MMTNNDVSFHLRIRKLLEFYGGAPYISGGFSGFIVPGLTEQGYFAPISQAIKEVVSIPVILTGGITEPEAAERLLAEKKADLIGVGRAILADSLWAKRAMEL